jgi:hypothetical protein
VDDRLAKEQKLGDGAWHVDEIGKLRDLLRVAAEQGMLVLLTSDHGHVVDRRGTQVGATQPASARHRLPGGDLDDREVALAGPRVVWPEPGASIVALWDADSRYTARKAGYHGGASLAEFTIPVLAFLRFGAAAPQGWRELGDQRPSWWSADDAAPVTEEPAPPVVRKSVPKVRKDEEAIARTHDALFDVSFTSGSDDALLTPTLVTADETLVAKLLDSDAYESQAGLLARKPKREQVQKALVALLGAGGTLPATALAERAGLPAARGDGFAAVLRQLLNFDGVQVLETLPDGRTLRLNKGLLRDQFELR